MIFRLRPVVLAAVDVKQTDSRAELTQLQGQDTGVGEGRAREQGEKMAIFVTW